MIDILHVYNNEPVMLTWEEISPDDGMSFFPCDILALYPEVFVSRIFDLIIFDVSCKDNSCEVIFKKFKEWFEISGATCPPIIVVVEKDSNLTEQSARIEGADFFFIKPIDMQGLVSVIHQIAVRNQNA